MLPQGNVTLKVLAPSGLKILTHPFEGQRFEQNIAGCLQNILFNSKSETIGHRQLPLSPTDVPFTELISMGTWTSNAGLANPPGLKCGSIHPMCYITAISAIQNKSLYPKVSVWPSIEVGQTSMASNSSRVKQEQLRKRRNNLLRRHNDFWLLYSIKSWLIMEGPNGRIYTYHSHPGLPVPTTKDMHDRPHPAIHKSPADYLPDGLDKLVVPELPLITPAARSEAVWKSLSLYLEEQSS